MLSFPGEAALEEVLLVVAAVVLASSFPGETALEGMG